MQIEKPNTIKPHKEIKKNIFRIKKFARLQKQISTQNVSFTLEIVCVSKIMKFIWNLYLYSNKYVKQNQRGREKNQCVKKF